MMKRILFIGIILVLIAFPSFQQIKETKAAPGDVEISDGSVTALYHFNDQSLTDNSGNGKDGTNGASPVSFTSSAKLGAYAANTGGSGYFTSVSSTMRIQGDFTIGFWVKPITTSWSDGGVAPYMIWRNIPASTQEGISYSIACTANRIEFVHESSCINNPAQTMSAGTWYWVLVRREGTSVDFYVDNVLKQNATDSKTTNVNAVVNFNGEVGRTGTANMYLDEIFFTTSAISTSTRDALWNSGNGAEICVTAGCGAVASGPIRRIIGTGIFR